MVHVQGQGMIWQRPIQNKNSVPSAPKKSAAMSLNNYGSGQPMQVHE
jgi:hypothetical protein